LDLAATGLSDEMPKSGGLNAMRQGRRRLLTAPFKP
jgi:hypothetical protein